MRSTNPVLSRSNAFSRGGAATLDNNSLTTEQLQGMYDAPSAVATRRMTMDDVVMRTGLLLLVAVATAAVAWQFRGASAAYPVAIGAAIGGFGIAMVVSFKRMINPPLIIAYAALEGVFLGIISGIFNDASNGIVVQAVLGTAAAFVGMLVAYRAGVIKVTPRFTKMLVGATIGFLLLAVTNWVFALVAGGDGLGLRSGVLGLLFGAVGIVLATLFLALDFHLVEQGIRAGAPERESWLAAFGLMVTLVWLYLEILRFISILRGD